MEQLEGRMDIASEPGCGVKVSVCFPLFADYQSRSA